MKRNARGFTLMELMVVIVIVAILAAVAVPLYINYVKDAQRTEAKGAIGAIITGEQAFYQRAVAEGAPAPTFTATMANLHVDLTDVATNWTFTITNASAAGFTVTANGITNRTTQGLQVQCIFARGADPQWSEL
jgi:type IV pilus assembly protein PilE